MDSNTSFWVAVIGAVGASVSALILGVVTLVLAYLRDINTAKEIGEIKENTREIKHTGNKVLKLNNSALLAIQRQLAAEMWKTARREGATEDDVRRAKAMDVIVAEHEANQKQIDEEEAQDRISKTGPPKPDEC